LSIKKIFFMNRWLLVISYAILIFVLTSVSSLSYPKFGFDPVDKIYHFLVYAVFSYLLFLALSQKENRFFKGNPHFFSILLGGAHALGSELYQISVPGRYCDFFDFLADFIGVVSVQFFLFVIQRSRKQKVES